MKTYPADHPFAEKIARNREMARAALEAYRGTGQHDEDDIAAISDLIADLMHLADEVGEDSSYEGEEEGFGHLVVRKAIDYGYDPEVRGEE